MTPEGRVKEHVKRIISRYGKRVYSHWPVLNGMGHPTLDCTGSAGGPSFAVETKAEGERLTPRQELTKRRMKDGGVTVFVIAGHDPFVLAEFDAWLRKQVGEPDVRR